MANSIINAVKWTTANTIVTTLSKLGQIAVLTRFLQKSDFGVVSIALLFISFTEIFVDMGFSAAVLHKQNITKNEYCSLYWFNIISGVLMYIILILITPFVAGYYKEPILESILPILSLNIIFSSVSRLQKTIQQKQLKFHIIAKISISASIVMLITSISLAINGAGIYSLVISTVVNYAIIAIVYLVYALFVEKNISLHFRLEEIVVFLKIGIYQVGSSLLNFFSSELDTIIISATFSMEILGVYTVCKQLAARVCLVINPIITNVLTPSLSIIQDNIDTVKQKFLKTLGVISFVNSPIYCLMILLAPFILKIIYGESYEENWIIFSLFCINYIISSIGNPQGALLVALGKTNYGFYWTIFRIIVTSLGLYVGSKFDINTLIITIIVVNCLSVIPEVKYIYKRLINTSFKEYIISFSSPVFFSFFIVIMLIGVRYLPIADIFVYPILGFLFCLLYLGASKRYMKEKYTAALQLVPSNIRKYLL